MFEKSENKDEGQQLISTLDQDDSFFDQVGQYDEYFFNLEKKLEITYNASALQVTSGSPNIINQQISINTIPEYLLYITPDQGQYSDSLYNTELLQFENYEETSVITSDIRNKIVKPHSGIESIDSIVWSGEKYEFHASDLDKDDLDDNTNISENEDIDFKEIQHTDITKYLLYKILPKTIQGLFWSITAYLWSKKIKHLI